MSWQEILEFIGINGMNAATIVAGFWGASASVFFNRKLDPIDVVSSYMIGVPTAFYAGPFLSDLTHLPNLFVCFMLGFGGLEALGRLFTMFRGQLGGKYDADVSKPPGVHLGSDQAPP